MRLSNAQAKRLGLVIPKAKSGSVIQKPLPYAEVELYCQAHGLPLPKREHQFHPVREWCFDFAWPEQKLALEIEGVLWQGGGGRHQRVAGYEEDCEKYTEAVALLGWRLIRATPKMLRSGWLWSILDRVIQKGKSNPEWIGDPG